MCVRVPFSYVLGSLGGACDESCHGINNAYPPIPHSQPKISRFSSSNKWLDHSQPSCQSFALASGAAPQLSMDMAKGVYVEDNCSTAAAIV